MIYHRFLNMKYTQIYNMYIRPNTDCYPEVLLANKYCSWRVELYL